MGVNTDAWKLAKAKYEAATNKKKPGKKFLLVFTKSSGIEPLLEKLDKKGDFDFPGRAAAIHQLKVKAAAYTALLEREIADDTKTNKDPTAAAAMKTALIALKADVAAIVTKMEAQQAHDLADYSAQVGKKEAADPKGEKQGRGMVNFGPDIKVVEQIVALVRKLEADLAHFAKNPTPAEFNKAPHGDILELCNYLRKFGTQYAELKQFSPFEKAMPATYDKKSVDLFVDQVQIILKRLKVTLKI